jgi:hypothetical protein
MKLVYVAIIGILSLHFNRLLHNSSFITVMPRFFSLMLSIYATISHGFLQIRPANFEKKFGTDLHSGSRIQGNQREPNPQDITIMDEMIRKMANAKPYELPGAVKRAFRICSSPQFFMRIAALSDESKDEMEKEKLSTLAANLASTIEVIITTTTEQLDERARDVEAIVKAAAEPDTGEFLVPLSKERLESIRVSLNEMEPYKLDENFLNTIDAWIVKSHQDGMDGMVTILQKVLQCYAGLQVLRAREESRKTSSSPTSALLDNLLSLDPESWDFEIRMGFQGGVTSSSLKAEIQRTMETAILGLENGTMAQRVQAEYLKELLTRAEAVKEN